MWTRVQEREVASIVFSFFHSLNFWSGHRYKSGKRAIQKMPTVPVGPASSLSSSKELWYRGRIFVLEGPRCPKIVITTKSMDALSRRCRSPSFALKIAPEPLFHDEEIAFSGTNISNPLWDSGNSCSSSLHDEDPLLPSMDFMTVARHVLTPVKKPHVDSKTSARRCLEQSIIVVAAIVFLGTVAGWVALSLL